MASCDIEAKCFGSIVLLRQNASSIKSKDSSFIKLKSQGLSYKHYKNPGKVEPSLWHFSNRWLLDIFKTLFSKAIYQLKNKNMKKERCLFGIFPVWMQFQDEKGNELNEMTGFWSDIACFVDQSLYFLATHLTFGMWDREEFAFFPYERNGCNNWFQAIWCILTKMKHE